MSAANVQTGTGRGATFYPTGGGSFELPLVAYNYTRTKNVTASATNSRDGILRLATLEDITGSASGPYDTDVEPGPDLAPGVTGVIHLWTDDSGARALKFTAILDPFSVDSGGQTDVMSVSFSFAKQSGTIVEPS